MSFADAAEILLEFSESSRYGGVDLTADAEWAVLSRSLRRRDYNLEYRRQPHRIRIRRLRYLAQRAEAGHRPYPITPLGITAAGLCPTCGARLERREGMSRAIHLGPVTKCARTGG